MSMTLKAPHVFGDQKRLNTMPSYIENPQLEISRQKFSELKKNVEQARKRNDVFQKMLRQGRVLALFVEIMRRFTANLERAIRLQGGVRNTIRQSLNEVRRVGLKGTFTIIFRRLSEPTEFDTVPNSRAHASIYEKTAPFKFKSKDEYEALYQTYLNNRIEDRNIAIFRAITGGYDQLLGYEHYINEADYFTFTDEPAIVPGLNFPVPYYDISSTRRARYVKLHPHMLFPNHKVAVWHDGNVMIRGDIRPLIENVLSSDMPIGAFLHPRRDNIYDEAQACIELNKDDQKLILNQVERYSEEGFQSDQLVESNFVIYNLRHPRLHRILAQWWAELDRGSCRDQLSFNYSIEAVKASFFALAERPTCTRNHPSFAFFANHGDQNGQRADKKLEGSGKPSFSHHSSVAKQIGKPKADVLICVHNALDDVKLCLGSVLKNQQDSVNRIIIIDDGSDHQTQQWLEEFAATKDNVTLSRNNEANGYTKAANKALSLSNSEHLILLNSDTIIGSQALKKMLACINRLNGCGIVGPLSNAASSQSIPRHLSAAGQTAINALPTGYSVDEMDNWCMENSRDLPSPGVPFVHGFCMCVKREVFDQVGYFDEEAFPYGYGEENDFCIRASESGFRLNIAIDAFVFHSKSKSYSDDKRRKNLMTAGNAKLRDLHGEVRVNRLVQSMEQNPILAKMRDRALGLYS